MVMQPRLACCKQQPNPQAKHLSPWAVAWLAVAHLWTVAQAAAPASTAAPQPLELALPASPVWQIQWQPAEQVSEVPSFAVPATWQADAAASRSFALPMAVQIEAILVKPGQRVKAGQPLLRLAGQAMLNFDIELELAREHAIAAEQRLSANQQRYQQGDITKATWLEWQHEVHLTTMAARMREQQAQLLALWHGQAIASGYQIAAPADGVVDLGALSVGQLLPEQTKLLTLQPTDALQLTLTLPLSQQPASAVQLGQCRIALQDIAAQSDAQRLHVFSEVLSAKQCTAEPQRLLAIIGQRVNVQPLYAQTALRLPLSSLLQMDGSDAVWVARDATKQSVELVKVQVLARDAQAIYVSPSAKLQQAVVASGDVAALKGMLQGLGGDA